MTWNKVPLPDKCVELIGGYINTNQDVNFTSDEFTIMVRCAFEDPFHNNFQNIIYKSDNAWKLSYVYGRPYALMKNSDGQTFANYLTTEINFQTEDTGDIGKWHWFSVVYDGECMTGYYNNEVMNVVITASGTPALISNNVLVGKYGTTDYVFIGKVSDVFIVDRAISVSELNKIIYYETEPYDTLISLKNEDITADGWRDATFVGNAIPKQRNSSGIYVEL